MIYFKRKAHYTFEDVIAIIQLLRSPEGCPWDQVQTHQSIRRNFLEETYEVCEAIDRDDPASMCEELGDVLTQVVFHADIEREAGRFGLQDVYDSICTKMLGRHPHIFAGGETSGHSASSWDELKRMEKGQTTQAETLQAVCKALPALWRAEKIQKKASNAGFLWDCAQEALISLAHEVQTLQETTLPGPQAKEALGDVLFAVVSVAFLCQIDPEDALHSACEQFVERFSRLEQSLAQKGCSVQELSKQELTSLWNRSP